MDWQPLFDGRTTRGWRSYRSDTLSRGWQVVDGALTRVAAAGDIVTVDRFADFELMLEWNVVPGGNSGLFFRAGEAEADISRTAPEIQILDDERHPDGRDPLTAAGALYGLYPAPPGAARPAGAWNRTRLRVEGARVAHWLNGRLTVRCEIGSLDWQVRVDHSKFATFPAFGSRASGHIGLQDHGDRVAFRDIRVRVLD